MIGQSFGNYRAVSLLGEGGMGVVYLAEHPEIGRKVAVKVLHRDYARDEQLLGRFLNEARAANAIRHPNIIEILDSGTLADRTPFLVMELLEGESLAARIKRVTQLPLRDAVDFAYQTASALSAAHAKGIVHRDLKPDNLFVVPDPHEADRERIKVLDFGIAKLLQPSPGDSVKTRTGTLMGTPIYMSPEQCRGIRSVDHRTDIYSLGVILYEMLVGQPPFVSEGFGDLVNMHINMAPPSPRMLRPDIPEALEALILKSLAKNPDDRFEGMIALQVALKAACEGFFPMRGSSPDISSAQHPRPGMGVSGIRGGGGIGVGVGVGVGGTGGMGGIGGTAVLGSDRQTTLSTGMGERVARGGSTGRNAALLIGALALAGVVVLAVRRQHDGAEKPTASQPPPITSSTTAAAQPALRPNDPPPPAKAAAEAKITIVIESMPAGARVVSAADGAVWGETPLKLTRPPGGPDLDFRVEKDGYLPIAHSIALEHDETLAVTLEKKRSVRPTHRAPAIDEPAKL
jgi:tRNA A-37 threonylcarbamoyl transferase component Bud32